MLTQEPGSGLPDRTIRVALQIGSSDATVREARLPGECQAAAGLPHTIGAHANCSCPLPTDQLDRRPGDPAGFARTSAEPCPGIGHRQQLDRDLHDTGFQVDPGRGSWLRASTRIGACPGALPLLLAPSADFRPSAGDGTVPVAAPAEARGPSRLPVCATHPACLGERAAARTPAVLLIA